MLLQVYIMKPMKCVSRKSKESSPDAVVTHAVTGVTFPSPEPVTPSGTPLSRKNSGVVGCRRRTICHRTAGNHLRTSEATAALVTKLSANYVLKR